uniref:Uncharacterized protein n=1 Tax=Rhizophora mucronata TaxID=61149 RepID=A0A2P2NAJ6_RHIMU
MEREVKVPVMSKNLSYIFLWRRCILLQLSLTFVHNLISRVQGMNLVLKNLINKEKQAPLGGH